MRTGSRKIVANEVVENRRFWINGQTGDFHNLNSGENHHEGAKRFFGMGVVSAVADGHIRGEVGTKAQAYQSPAPWSVFEGKSRSLFRHKNAIQPVIKQVLLGGGTSDIDVVHNGSWPGNMKRTSFHIGNGSNHSKFWTEGVKDGGL
jgi:hypothetical protein